MRTSTIAVFFRSLSTWWLLGTLLVCLAQPAWSQEVVVAGQVTDAETGAPIGTATVSVGGGAGSATDALGKFVLRLPRKTARLQVRHLAYQARTVVLPLDSARDTVLVSIALTFKTQLVDTVTISAAPRPPDTLFGSAYFHVANFAFAGDRMIHLVYTHKLHKKATLMLVGSGETVLDRLAVPGTAEDLYTDFLGFVNVVTREAVYRILVEEDHLNLVRMDRPSFEVTIKPGIDTLDRHILFSDYRWDFPAFQYYRFGLEDSVVSAFKQVKDEEMYRNFRYEYYFLQPHEKVWARKMAMQTGQDKHEIAAWMTGFAESFYFDPLYAPLFVVEDAILVFDHHSDQRYRYDREANLQDSTEITYHQKEHGSRWKKRLLQDAVDGTIYAVFEQQGFTILKELDAQSGTVKRSVRLTHRYLENIQIRNGKAYYLHQPANSRQNWFVYEEDLAAK